MILSERREFIFLHNPKCGGTSVREALMQFDTTSNFFWMYDKWNEFTIDKAHLPLFIFRNKYPQYFRLMRKYFTFMIVRDPYARTASAYDENNAELADIKFYLPGGESLYREQLNKFIREMNRDLLVGWETGFRHFVRQVDLAYLGKKSFVDLILKLEEWPGCLNKLRHFLPDVADLLEAAEKRNLRHARRNCMEYLTDESIEKINELYQADFDVFGYAMVRP